MRTLRMDRLGFRIVVCLRLSLYHNTAHKSIRSPIDLVTQLSTPTFSSLSIPPEKICSAVSLKLTAVTWYVDWNVFTGALCLVSQTCEAGDTGIMKDSPAAFIII